MAAAAIVAHGACGDQSVIAGIGGRRVRRGEMGASMQRTGRQRMRTIAHDGAAGEYIGRGAERGCVGLSAPVCVEYGGQCRHASLPLGSIE